MDADLDENLAEDGEKNENYYEEDFASDFDRWVRFPSRFSISLFWKFVTNDSQLHKQWLE